MYVFSRKEDVDNVDNVDNSAQDILQLVKNKCSHTQFRGFPKIKPEKKLFTKNEGNKNIHSLCFLLNVDKAVDNVDKLALDKVFSNFYNVSGTHSY